MPSTKGLKELVRQSKMTPERWLSLIEARRELIKPHLDSFTLPELGAWDLLKSEYCKHALHVDDPKIEPGCFSLRTQGIFSLPMRGQQRFPGTGYLPPPRSGGCCYPNGTINAWGLTRSNQWILVTIQYVGEAGYETRGYERATSVLIIKVNVPIILEKTGESAFEMWRVLGEAINKWAKHRRELYEKAMDLLRVVQIEEMALSCIPR